MNIEEGSSVEDLNFLNSCKVGINTIESIDVNRIGEFVLTTGNEIEEILPNQIRWVDDLKIFQGMFKNHYLLEFPGNLVSQYDSLDYARTFLYFYSVILSNYSLELIHQIQVSVGEEKGEKMRELNKYLVDKGRNILRSFECIGRPNLNGLQNVLDFLQEKYYRN